VNRTGFSLRLELRQTQALVMTPQLQQAIKMLQLSNLELADYVDAEIEQNPLLELGDGDDGSATPGGADTAPGADGGNGAAEPGVGEFSTDAVEQWQASAGADGFMDPWSRGGGVAQ